MSFGTIPYIFYITVLFSFNKYSHKLYDSHKDVMLIDILKVNK